ncbi:flagellar basal body P-ring protein FlgI [Planktomarina temperata]|jgi:flagellar P-ring protein precursor FlgI|nr:flagellar basal body P-ring protein FlgI [Planktomarina temperata]MDA8820919.1 flagellar basal body P-ring protein FlgI [Planktomarina temperata]MDA9152456.1 flagellar basal body P-ring protein FlgI [Planktomarina temperata]MDB4854268.1 flagellar basal body P-ring protein FlgI [Planktomarina temperata]MDC1467524.1 flagellar basal body P-ring protein FlgI [Planktomarina temperata]
MKKLISLLLFCGLFQSFILPAQADRIKDITSLAGIRSNQLVGYGIVVGLAGSGDGNTGITLQSMQALVARFGITSTLDGFNGDNAAAVMLTAELPPFSKPGQTIDVTVSTIGGSESLKGGTLLMSPLLGSDGETYAIAQGNVVVGGLGVEGADNSSLTVNIPTVGRIPGGASVERMVETAFLDTDFVILNLHQGDFSTALNISQVINETFGDGMAMPLDKNSVRVRAPNDPSQKVGFVSMLENLEVEKASPPAKIIINSRTGTIVISGDVKVMAAAVAHGSLKVTVNEDVNVDQADALAVGAGANANAGPAVENPDTEIEVEEAVAKAFLFGQGVSLSDIVDSINAVGATSSDLVAILEALREAGALNAELIVI